MFPTKIYTLTIAANQSQRLLVQGEYFKVMSCSGPITVLSDFGRLDSLIAGQGLENTPFPYLLLTDASGGSNTVKILVGDQNFIDGMTGSFVITSGKQPQSGAFTNVNATVTNASAQLLAANANRQYLLIQNNGAGDIYVNFGAAATLANGIKIAAGGAFELPGTVSTQQVFAIGSVASNTAVITLEG